MRVSPIHKALIEEAAAVQGQAVSAFAVATLIARARKILDEHDKTILSRRDQERFLDILDSDEPNEALKKAALRFVKRHG